MTITVPENDIGFEATYGRITAAITVLASNLIGPCIVCNVECELKVFHKESGDTEYQFLIEIADETS